MADTTETEQLVDLDANPDMPSGLMVEEHHKGGRFKWDASKVALYLSERQHLGNKIDGNQLHDEIRGQPVYNENLLDYLLKNPQLFPAKWKKDEEGNVPFIFFWGTIYRDRCDHLCVRCLYWDDDRGCPGSGFDWLDDYWRERGSAAVRTS